MVATTDVDSKKSVDVESGEERTAWGGKLEFVLTLIGFSVGLGNVWRFPYLCYENGGGAFLIPYTIMLTLVGLPMFFLEISFGQFASLGPITAWSVSPVFRGVGVAGVIVASYIALYYNVVVSWCLYYFFAAMNTKLPWTTCGNWWNSDYCIEQGGNTTVIGNITETNITYRTSSEEYYYDKVLRISDGLHDMGGIRWDLALCLLLAWIIVFLVLIKGISSLGKVSYFLALFPYVLLTIMLARGMTLPGSVDGILFYLKPDFSRLLEPKIWGDAAVQVFYAMSVSTGGLIAMASFNQFRNNILRDAFIVPYVNLFTSLYAGFVIFAILGYMAHEKGVPVSEVAAEGPGLVFVVYPEGLATMPAAPVWAILFYFMMTILGFSSQFSMVEGVASAFIDEYPSLLRHGRRPTYMRTVLCGGLFLLGLPMVTKGGFYMLQIVDNYAASFTLLTVALLEIIALVYVYGYNRFAKDIEMMLGKKPWLFWRITWCFISPLVIIAVFVSKVLQSSQLRFGDYIYPWWANAIGWCIVAFPIFIIVAFFLGSYCIHGGLQALKQASSPTNNWGPARAEHRTGIYAKSEKDEISIPIQNRADVTHVEEVNSTPGTNMKNFSRPPSYNGIVKTCGGASEEKGVINEGLDLNEDDVNGVNSNSSGEISDLSVASENKLNSSTVIEASSSL